jgi:outer membrane protein OmpA-like peptidoglycan-associated protein
LSVLGGVVTFCAIVSAAAFMYRDKGMTAEKVDESWRRRELAFLAAANDRIEADLAGGSSPGTAARREMQHSILQRMAEVAKPMPSDAIPDNVKAVLKSADLSNDDKVDPASPGVATAPPPTSSDEAGTDAGPSSGDSPPTDDAGPDKTAPAPVDPTPAVPVAAAAAPAAEPAPPEPTASADPAPPADALQTEKTDRGLRIRLPADVLFGSGSEALDPAAESSLMGVLAIEKKMQPREVVVVGHGEASGKRDVELALAKKRASAVSGWLKDHGLGGQERLVARAEPPARSSNRSDNPDEREQGARIEILLRRR